MTDSDWVFAVYIGAMLAYIGVLWWASRPKKPKAPFDGTGWTEVREAPEIVYGAMPPHRKTCEACYGVGWFGIMEPVRCPTCNGVGTVDSGKPPPDAWPVWSVPLRADSLPSICVKCNGIGFLPMPYPQDMLCCPVCKGGGMLPPKKK
jgi:hypothetical protein